MTIVYSINNISAANEKKINLLKQLSVSEFNEIFDDYEFKNIDGNYCNFDNRKNEYISINKKKTKIIYIKQEENAVVTVTHQLKKGIVETKKQTILQNDMF